MQAFINDLAEAWVNDAEIGPAHEKLKDPELMCLFKEKMFHYFKYKMDGLKYYIGQSLSEVHWPLGITDLMFDKAVSIVISTLKKQKPKLAVFREFSKRISDLRSQIVTPNDYMQAINEDLRLESEAEESKQYAAVPDKKDLDQKDLFDALGCEKGIN